MDNNEHQEFLDDDELFKCLLEASAYNYKITRIAKESNMATQSLYNYNAGNARLSMKKKIKIIQLLTANYPEAFERAKAFRRIGEEIKLREAKQNEQSENY